MKIYLTAKIEKFYVDYQEVLGKHIAAAGQPDFAKTIEALDVLEKSLGISLGKSEFEKSEYYGVFKDFLGSLKQLCRDAAGITGNDTESLKLRGKIIRELRANARNFRFDLLVRSGGTEY